MNKLKSTFLFCVILLSSKNLITGPGLSIKNSITNFLYFIISYKSLKMIDGFWALKKESSFDFCWNKVKKHWLRKEYLKECQSESLKKLINNLLEIYVETSSVEKQVLIKSQLDFILQFIKKQNKIYSLKKNNTLLFYKHNKQLNIMLPPKETFYLGKTPVCTSRKNDSLLEKIIKKIPLQSVVIDCKDLEEKDLLQAQKNNDESIFIQQGFFEKLFITIHPNKHFLIFKNFDKIENPNIKNIFISFFKNGKEYFDTFLQEYLSFKNVLILILINEEKAWFKKEFNWNKNQLSEQIVHGSIEKLLQFPILKFCKNKEYIDVLKEKQTELINLFKKSNSGGLDETLRHFKNLLLVSIASHKELTPSLIKIKETLDQKIFKLDLVKEELLNYAALSSMSKNFGRVLCLVGPPGVGKTYFSEVVAQALERSLFKISAPSLVHHGQLKGMPRSYQQAEPGIFANAILKTGNKDVVVLFDEFDKLVLKRPELMFSLLEVFDPLQRNNIFDNYLGVNLDLSSFFFILTANDISCFPDYLMDRCFFVFLEDYDSIGKAEILSHFFIPKFLAQFDLKESSIIFLDEACSFLVTKYPKASLRELQKKIEIIVGKIFSSNLLKKGPIKITASFLGSIDFSNNSKLL